MALLSKVVPSNVKNLASNIKVYKCKGRFSMLDFSVNATLFSLFEEFVAVHVAYVVESGFQQLASFR